MSKTNNKTLIFIIAILLITNIVLLASLLRRQRSENKSLLGINKNSDPLIEALQKKVGFNEIQVAQYKQLKDRKWASMKSKFDGVRAAKDNFFSLISKETISDSLLNAASDVIVQWQKKLDLEAFSHFKEVRKLCKTPEQQIKYDSLVQHMFFKLAGAMRRDAAQKNNLPPAK